VGKVHQCPVERLGLDENFIDVTSIVKERKKSGDYVKNVTGHVYGEKRSDCSCDCDCDENMVVGSILAAEIRKRIFETVGLTTSCGVSHNKLLAKLAGAIHKPNQQTTMFPCNGAEFISSLASARAIPGIGSSTFKILESKGLSSIGSIRESSVEFLSTFLGKN
jgi:DNA polymerase iota